MGRSLEGAWFRVELTSAVGLASQAVVPEFGRFGISPLGEAHDPTLANYYRQ